MLAALPSAFTLEKTNRRASSQTSKHPIQGSHYGRAIKNHERGWLMTTRSASGKVQASITWESRGIIIKGFISSFT
ncbi:hypothetical protein AMECASPLE_017374 [Ameca splendens]|uniref:Uncharacterized protein n=1 Tax=Ameca splendens TaxID=208324 RepID=A0ABV1A8U5_9TELE